MCVGPVKVLVLALSTASAAFLRTSRTSVHDARTSVCHTMPAPRRGGTTVAIFWSPFCYLPEYLPPHVMTIHECYEIDSYYRGLLMPFVTVPLSVAGFLFAARFMLEPGFMQDDADPKAEAHARALRHDAFISHMYGSGDPDQVALANRLVYEFVFKSKMLENNLEQYAQALVDVRTTVDDLGYATMEPMEGLSAEQVGAIADHLKMKPRDKRRFVDAFAPDAYKDVLRVLEARQLQLIRPIAQPGQSDREVFARELEYRVRLGNSLKRLGRPLCANSCDIEWLRERGEPLAAKLMQMPSEEESERYLDLNEEIFEWAGLKEELFRFKESRAKVRLGSVIAALERSYSRGGAA